MRVPAVVVLAILPWPSLLAAPERFEPESCFPRDCFYYLSVDCGALKAGLQDTPFARVLLHPGVRKALGRLPDMLLEKLRQETEELREGTGMDPWEIADLLSGQVALTISGVDMLSGPRMLIAVELGAKRKGILDLVGRMESLATSSGIGADARQTAEVKGVQVTTWTMPFGPSIQHGVIGTHFVFSVGIGMETVIDRFAKGAEETQDALRFNPTYARARLQAGGFTPALTVFLNWEAIRATIALFMGEIPMAQEMQRGFAAVGLDKLSSFTYRLGFRDGDLEGKVYLDSPGGLSGLLGLLAECVGPPEDSAALARVPAEATEHMAFSIQLGRLAREALQKVREGFPDSGPALDAFQRELEGAAGISLADDVYKLPKLSVHAFNVLPPAGGLIPDGVLIVKTAQFEPYLRLVDQVARRLGAEVSNVQVGDREVAYLTISSLYRKLGIGPASFPSAQAASFLSIFEDLEPSLTLAFAPADDEWMVIATTPQAVGRYFSSYSKGKTAADEGGFAGLVRKEVGSEAAYAVYRGGRHFLAAYNTLASLAVMAAPSFEDELKAYGVDLAHLPPGEELSAGFRDGFFLLRPTKDGLLLHGHRVISNALGSPSLAASFLVPAVTAGLKHALKSKLGGSDPAERLKAIGAILKAHAERSGSGAYTHDAEGTLAALQAVVDDESLPAADRERLLDLLVHPAGKERRARAAPGEEGIELAPENVSYELVPWKQGPKDNPARILAYEKRAYDGSGRHVLYVDLSVKRLPEAELQALLEEQTARYGKKAEAAEGEEEKDKEE
ncbi:MAG: hypothetical protein HY721_09270 [Planctomycetes bacterium]|nr:hypothetical protein [Planctomycetota bacterium]